MKDLILAAVKDTGIEPEALEAFISVESSGKGFIDGKLIIQFEPAYFRKRQPFAPSGKWSVNKVERQSAEWEAFNNAFKINPTSAMESTSIGLPQIMGAHWARLGYSSVGEMWDDFKTSEEAQIKALVRFILTDKRLHNAIVGKDWHKVAMYYNGQGYAAFAFKQGREPYNISLKNAYEKYKGA